MIRTTFRLSVLLAVLASSVGTQVRADYLYTVSGLPTPIVSGQSIVVFGVNPTPNHALPGATSANLAIGNVFGFSGNLAGGDNFNTSFSMKIDFADPAHPGGDTSASFAGTLGGNLAKGQSSLFLQFVGQTVNIDLAGNTYAVIMPATSIMVTGDGAQKPFGVQVQFNGHSVSQVPEPSGLLLAGIGIPLLGLMRRRKGASRVRA